MQIHCTSRKTFRDTVHSIWLCRWVNTATGHRLCWKRFVCFALFVAPVVVKYFYINTSEKKKVHRTHVCSVQSDISFRGLIQRVTHWCQSMRYKWNQSHIDYFLNLLITLWTNNTPQILRTNIRVKIRDAMCLRVTLLHVLSSVYLGMEWNTHTQVHVVVVAVLTLTLCSWNDWATGARHVSHTDRSSEVR